MSELSLAIQKEVREKIASRAVVINGRGDVSVDGVLLLGLDGKRTLKLFGEGVTQDIAEYGPAETAKLYGKKARTSGGLGHALQASVKLSRMLDVDMIAGR